MTDTYLKKGFRTYILLTATLCGAIVMMIEVLGSRVVGPFFGVSLFVWTSLITITLLALALGYAFGGYLSDKRSDPVYLYLIILASGALCLLVPFIKVPVLKACTDLGLRGGAFVSTLILFGPALFLLGCVSPFLAKIATRQLSNIGSVVGGLYALSTLGSTIGTVLTGFFIVGYLGIDKSFYLVGLLLLMLGASYFIFYQRDWRVAFVAILPLVAYPDHQFESKQLASGALAQIVSHTENYYGSIKVLDVNSKAKHAKYLLLDNIIQGGVDVSNGLSIFPYSYHMQFLSYAKNPNGRKCLAIGLGVGAAINFLESQGKVCDVVDINPAIFKVAREHFNYQPKGKTYIQDGRYFLENSSESYDYVLMDVFSGELTPSHLLSLEAVTSISKRMTEDAVLAINLINRLGQGNITVPSVVLTLRKVFRNVEVYPIAEQKKNKKNKVKVENIMVLAYQGEPVNLDFSGIKNFEIHPFYKPSVLRQLGRKYEMGDLSSALVLTDDYNPIDYFDADVREQIRKEVQRGLDVDIQLL